MNPAELVPQGVDMDFLVQPMHQILLCRRRDGSWALSYNHVNPRTRRRTLRAEGTDLADCLRDLEAQITQQIMAEAEKDAPA